MKNETIPTEVAQVETAQTENVTPAPKRRFFQRLSRKTRLSILGVTLLAVGAASLAILNQVVPQSPTRAQSFTDRLAWYVQQGQLKADLHTLASAVEYVVTGEAQPTGEPAPVNPAVAGSVPPTPPKS